jgi:hypothetical protein
MTARSRLLCVLLAASIAAPPHAAFAADPAAPAPPDSSDATTARARDLFSQGALLSRRMQWAEALEMFEEVARLRPHSVVTYNIGVCERALGRYTRARRTFAAFLSAASATTTGDVPAALVDDARSYQRELEELIVHLHVTLRPSDARLAVDGRPLTLERPGVLVAGLAASGAAETPASDDFELILDPGVHVIRASRDGHADAILNRSYPPATRTGLNLELETLPAQLHVESAVPNAVVLIDGRDVGLAPVDLSRPAGTYRVEVQRASFAPYSTSVRLDAGEHASIVARLTPESTPITSKWWFWTGAAAILAGGVVATYALTRPSPQPPPYQGGSTGWVVTLP